MDEIFRISDDVKLDENKLSEYINKHKSQVEKNFKPLDNAYKNNYEIFDYAKNPKKADYKPDNRLAVNFAKYITDTMDGFFIGIPIKLDSEDERVKKYVEELDAYNNQDDQNAELSKLMSVFGRGYEMYYVDEHEQIGIINLSPMQSFMIYDDSILCRRKYFVRYYVDSNKKVRGSISDCKHIRYFEMPDKLRFIGKEKLHGFDGVPAVEYRENEERQGIFEDVLSIINEYNKALSEKANDVDYFADSYLKVLGSKLEEKDLKNIRSNRIINLEGDGSEKIIVEFLEKPNADESQENLLDRLERLIFTISMIPNMSDEKFDTASGIALRYKLLAMQNLFKTKERKFISGLNNRYKLIFSNPVSGMQKDSWVTVKATFTPNYPANVGDEAEIASKLSGITSKRTQLSVLSVVDDVDAELKSIEEECDPVGYNTEYPTNRIE